MYRPDLAYKADYLYEAWYDVLDYAYAYEWFRSHTPAIAGACSTVRKGNLIGRNLDWTYGESAEFIVHAGNTVGVANAIPTLTDAFVKSGADSELYKIVPFMLADGINRHGLFVSTLVVPTDKGDNSVVYPSVKTSVELCTLMLPRWVLDFWETASGACNALSMYAKLYHPKTLQDQKYDQHFVIADSRDTFCMEFVDGQYVIQNISAKPYVTNFHLSGVLFNADGSVNTPARGKASDNHITDNGSGLERYNLINSHTGDIQSLMRDLTFTRAYQSSANPAVPRWDTEFVGNGRTVDTPTAGYDSAQAIAARMYLDRSRVLGETWQTVHSAIYDIEHKSFILQAQENNDTQWEVSVMPDQTHIQRLRGDTAKNDNYTGLDGELTINKDSNSVRIHNGVEQGGFGTVHATYMDELPADGIAPKDLPEGSHVIVGEGALPGGGLATPTNPGLVMPGDGLSIDASGKLSTVLKVATHDMTFYVRKTGSDDNDGLAEDTAFLTVERACEESLNYAYGSYSYTIDIGSGTFTLQQNLTFVKRNTHSPWPTLVGTGIDTTIIQINSNYPTVAVTGGIAQFSNLTLRNTGTGAAIMVQASGGADLSNVSLETTARTGASTPLRVFSLARAYLHDTIRITTSVSSTELIIADSLSNIHFAGAKISVSGSVTSCVVGAIRDSTITFNTACTFSGAVTGVRYIANKNSVIDTLGKGANFIPGSSAGATATGGIYV